ncbi:molybdopterin synthase sulfur carrier subunit-like protein [Geranomyces variabilis]|nr:molybdopterin synthase sulfur carrier subunit-like protein [Geranomyces variabilis]KAJ3140160.1 hypothetical protein HDU90_008384 [Geranomyces variabilis]
MHALFPLFLFQFQVLYFASARDATSVREETLSVPNDSQTLPVPQLIQILIARHPGLEAVFKAAILAINNQYVDHAGCELDGGRTVEVKPGDEVAVIPPVSGG